MPASIVLTATEPMRRSPLPDSAERRAGIEPEPAERQDEAAAEHDHDVVAGNGVRLAVARELADARADDDAPAPAR